MARSACPKLRMQSRRDGVNAVSIADALLQPGWWVGHHQLTPGLLAALAVEAQALHHDGEMHQAGVGRGVHHHRDSLTRSDSIVWFDGVSAAQQQYLAVMEALRLSLNSQLFLGLFEYEAHFAFYAPGAFYHEHLDSFAGVGGRIVSVVTYLNADWPSNGGGELLIHAQTHKDVAATIVLPEAGTVVIFLSEQVLHEVLPAMVGRYSIAGWFRLNAPD
ncbi:MAG TPA: 2OG-Fe(II) oxygenase [Pseudomonadales bacterium]|nr:2OG-Fe(II) oxygenase [Pseudomonadales bacterium]